MADDDESLRRLEVVLLERDGYRVVEARDGLEALAHGHGPPRGVAAMVDRPTRTGTWLVFLGTRISSILSSFGADI